MSADANIVVNIDSSSIDDFIAKYVEALDGQTPEELEDELDNIAEKAEDVQGKVGSADRTLNRLLFKVAPQLRQLRQMERAMKQMRSGAMGMGVLTAVFLAYQVVQQIDAYLVKLEQERRDLEVTLREARGLDSRGAYEGWRREQKELVAGSRIVR